MRKRERKLLFVYTNVFLQGNQAIEKREPKVDLTLKLEALLGDFARRINNNIESLHERMDKLELSQTPSKGR